MATPGEDWLIIHADGLGKALAPTAPSIPMAGGRDAGVLGQVAMRVLMAFREMDHQPSHLVVVRRDGIDSERLAVDERFGRLPSADPESYARSKDLVDALWFSMGGFVLEEPDIRAGDLATGLSGGKRSVTLLSKDRSTHVLRARGVRILDPMRPGAMTIEREDPIRNHALLCLIGYPALGVSGVSGVGEKRARQLLDDMGGLDAIESHWRSIGSPKADELRRVRYLLGPRSIPVPSDLPETARWTPTALLAASSLLAEHGLKGLAGGMERLARS